MRLLTWKRCVKLVFEEVTQAGTVLLLYNFAGQRLLSGIFAACFAVDALESVDCGLLSTPLLAALRRSSQGDIK